MSTSQIDDILSVSDGLADGHGGYVPGDDHVMQKLLTGYPPFDGYADHYVGMQDVAPFECLCGTNLGGGVDKLRIVPFPAIVEFELMVELSLRMMFVDYTLLLYTPDEPDDPIVRHGGMRASAFGGNVIPTADEALAVYGAFAERNGIESRLDRDHSFYVLLLECPEDIPEKLMLAMSDRTSDAGVLLTERLLERTYDDQFRIDLV